MWFAALKRLAATELSRKNNADTSRDWLDDSRRASHIFTDIHDIENYRVELISESGILHVESIGDLAILNVEAHVLHQLVDVLRKALMVHESEG
jgi:hypothetical protein